MEVRLPALERGLLLQKPASVCGRREERNEDN
jgi:hypothetical protein